MKNPNKLKDLNGDAVEWKTSKRKNFEKALKKVKAATVVIAYNRLANAGANVLELDGKDGLVRVNFKRVLRGDLVKYKIEWLDDEEFEDVKVLNGKFIGVKKNGKWWILDSQLKVVLEPSLDEIIGNGREDESYIYRKWTKYGFITPNLSILECKYDSADHFFKGFFAVSNWGKKWIVDMYGKEVIGPRYEEIKIAWRHWKESVWSDGQKRESRVRAEKFYMVWKVGDKREMFDREGNIIKTFDKIKYTRDTVSEVMENWKREYFDYKKLQEK